MATTEPDEAYRFDPEAASEAAVWDSKPGKNYWRVGLGGSVWLDARELLADSHFSAAKIEVRLEIQPKLSGSTSKETLQSKRRVGRQRARFIQNARDSVRGYSQDR